MAERCAPPRCGAPSPGCRSERDMACKRPFPLSARFFAMADRQEQLWGTAAAACKRLAAALPAGKADDSGVQDLTASLRLLAEPPHSAPPADFLR